MAEQHCVLKCLRCGHEWQSRLPVHQRPKKCALCGEPCVDPENGETMVVEVDTIQPTAPMDGMLKDALKVLDEILLRCDQTCTRPGHQRGLVILERAGLRKRRAA